SAARSRSSIASHESPTAVHAGRFRIPRAAVDTRVALGPRSAFRTLDAVRRRQHDFPITALGHGYSLRLGSAEADDTEMTIRNASRPSCRSETGSPRRRLDWVLAATPDFEVTDHEGV